MPMFQGGGNQIPKGVIMLWYGTLVSIPAGYQHCDGTNSTPDLRGINVIGARAQSAPYGIGQALGGAHSHDSGNPVLMPYTSGDGVASGTDFSTTTATGTTGTADGSPSSKCYCYIMKM